MLLQFNIISDDSDRTVHSGSSENSDLEIDEILNWFNFKNFSCLLCLYILPLWHDFVLKCTVWNFSTYTQRPTMTQTTVHSASSASWRSIKC